MKLLFLAPQPFYEERGTPIAVRLALTVLAERYTGEKVSRIDLLTYHVGRESKILGVTTHRIPNIPFIKSVRPGISFAKLICDLFFFFKLIQLLYRAREDQYELVHAVEESAFFALICQVFFGIPFIYDMDSSLSLQLTEKWWFLKPLRPIFEYFEGQLIRRAVAVVPVCDALATIARNHGKDSPIILSDISLLEVNDEAEDLKATLGLPADALITLYSGNLERYQGIDLLIESFVKVALYTSNSFLVIIGGSREDRDKYMKMCSDKKLEDRVFIIGPRPVHALYGYLKQADILVSPRTMGNNTPMKIYSYLHSGRPMVATRLPTHTQVLTDDIAVLAEPDSDSFSKGLIKLISSESLRASIGQAAFQLAEQKYTFPAFKRSLNQIYDQLKVA
jgi:glycosyltransferase involved in cell wall biosynthesis